MKKHEKGQQSLTCDKIKKECEETGDPLVLWDPVGINFGVLRKEKNYIKEEDLSLNDTDNVELKHTATERECEHDSDTSFASLFGYYSETSKQNLEKEVASCGKLEFHNKHDTKRCKRIPRTIEHIHFQEKDEIYEKKFSCGDCDKRYFGYRLLQKHINDEHLKTCNYNETFSLPCHTNKRKEREKHFECQVCHKKFSHSSHLKQHSVVHRRENVVKNSGGKLPVVQHEDQQTLKNVFEDTNKKTYFYQKDKVYTCSICDRRYTEHRRLKSHIEAIHLGLNDYKCAQCNKTYSSIKVLVKHTKMIHSVSKYKYECEVCHKKFAHLSYLKSHSIIHTTRKYACADCGWKYFRYKDLKQHVKFSCQANLNSRHVKHKKYSCSVCGRKYTMLGNLQTHTRKVHSQIAHYKCAHCCKTYLRINSLKKHINSEHSLKKYECEVCHKEFSTLSYLRNHSVIHTTKKYECADCGCKFFAYYLLKRHIMFKCPANLSAMNKVKYSCDSCDKKYLRFCNLQAHVRLVHLGITDYVCEQCNKAYTRLSALQRHNKQVHSVKKYKCTECNKKYSQLCLLKKHINTHKGTKKYVCEDCDKRFFTHSHLKKHIDVVHNEIKDHQCEECGKRFSVSHHLENHINTVHKKIRKYECQFCYKTFQASHHLQNHIICVHQKVKNFVCDQCGDRFLLAHHLRNHVKYVHVGVKR